MKAASPRRIDGFSLPELIIALGILSVLSAALLLSQMDFSRAFARLAANAEIHQSVHRFESVFARDVRQARTTTRRNARILRLELPDGHTIDYEFGHRGRNQTSTLIRKANGMETVLFEQLSDWSFEPARAGQPCRMELTVEYRVPGRGIRELEVIRQVAPRART